MYFYEEENRTEPKTVTCKLYPHNTKCIPATDTFLFEYKDEVKVRTKDNTLSRKIYNFISNKRIKPGDTLIIYMMENPKGRYNTYDVQETFIEECLEHKINLIINYYTSKGGRGVFHTLSLTQEGAYVR